MQPALLSKLPHIGTTIFTTMSALSAEHGAVNLGQGFPDFQCDPRLVEALADASRAGHNQYPPMAGIPALRERVAEKVASLYGCRYDAAAEITITAGATQAIHTALTALVRPGDEVIVFEPAYDSYEPSITMNGGTVVYATLEAPHYRPDWEQVRALITPRTRALLLNTPHNPTATCWPVEDMQALDGLLRDTGVVVISDEVYEHMVYDGRRHESVARHPGLAERAIVISSFGKTYHVTGWKVAYALAPATLMAEFRKAHQFIVFTVHTPSQHALAAYMTHATHLELPAFYQAKRDLFLEAVRKVPLAWMASAGSYFVSAGFRHLPAFERLSDLEFARHLTQHLGVACIPLSAFHHDGRDTGIVRFCFAKRDDTLEEAARRLARLGDVA